jgi:hypothetical protein
MTRSRTVAWPSDRRASPARPSRSGRPARPAAVRVLGTSSRPSVPASPGALPLEMSQALPAAASTTAASTSVDAAAAPLWPDVAVSAVAAWWTTAARVGEYWTGAAGRGAAHLDVAADPRALLGHRAAEGSADGRLRTRRPEQPLALLRSFCEPSGSTSCRRSWSRRSQSPSSIVDYSQVNAIRSAGRPHLCTRLARRDAGHPGAGIEDYVAELEAASTRSAAAPT